LATPYSGKLSLEHQKKLNYLAHALFLKALNKSLWFLTRHKVTNKLQSLLNHT